MVTRSPINQASADYAVTPSLRVGALYGWIRDDACTGKHASGGSIGAFYTIKNTSCSCSPTCSTTIAMPGSGRSDPPA